MSKSSPSEKNLPGREEKLAVRRLLHERARVLAQPRREEASQARGLEVLAFTVEEDRYALPVSVLREIFPISRLARLPGLPGYVLGVVIIRGQPVSLLDLRVLLGLSPSTVTDESCAIVLENQTMTFSILANRVGGIDFLHEEDLEAGKPALDRLDPLYIRGITRDRIVLIHAEQLLSDPALIVDDQPSL